MRGCPVPRHTHHTPSPHFANMHALSAPALRPSLPLCAADGRPGIQRQGWCAGAGFNCRSTNDLVHPALPPQRHHRLRRRALVLQRNRQGLPRQQACLPSQHDGDTGARVCRWAYSGVEWRATARAPPRPCAAPPSPSPAAAIPWLQAFLTGGCPPYASENGMVFSGQSLTSDAVAAGIIPRQVVRQGVLVLGERARVDLPACSLGSRRLPSGCNTASAPSPAVWHLLPAAPKGRQLCLPPCAQLGNRAGPCGSHRSRPRGGPVIRPTGASRPRARLLPQPSQPGHTAACARHQQAPADPVPSHPSHLRQVRAAAGKRACGAGWHTGPAYRARATLSFTAACPLTPPAGGTRALSASRLCPWPPSRPSTTTLLWPASRCVQAIWDAGVCNLPQASGMSGSRPAGVGSQRRSRRLPAPASTDSGSPPPDPALCQHLGRVRRQHAATGDTGARDQRLGVCVLRVARLTAHQCCPAGSHQDRTAQHGQLAVLPSSAPAACRH